MLFEPASCPSERRPTRLLRAKQRLQDGVHLCKPRATRIGRRCGFLHIFSCDSAKDGGPNEELEAVSMSTTSWRAFRYCSQSALKLLAPAEAAVDILLAVTIDRKDWALTWSSQILRRAQYSTSGSSRTPLQAPTSDSILSAYSSPSGLHPLSNVSADIDYLALDDAALSSIAGSQSVLPHRGWSDELCYGTGTVYVSGLALGGIWGLREGWARSRAIAAARMARSAAAQLEKSALGESGAAAGAGSAPGAGRGFGPAAAGSSTTAGKGAAAAALDGAMGATPGGISWRLRLNAILNGITRRGSFTGNTCGVLGPSRSLRRSEPPTKLTWRVQH